MSPELSIITICYNEKNIENTCISILNQAWQDFEWIVIDGGSEPWCTEILEKYQDRMAFYVSEKDNGVYDAMNKGIAQAKGKYTLFMNAGNSFLNGKTLEKVSTYFSKNANVSCADVFYGDAVLKMPEGSYKYKILPSKIDDSFFIKDYITPQSTYIKTDLFQKFGVYSTDYKIVSDLKKWIEFMQSGCTFEHLPFLCTIFDYSGISATHKKCYREERAQILPEYFTKEIIDCSSFNGAPQNSNPYVNTTDTAPIAITNQRKVPKKADISIIVPVFNTALYLSDCLNSLLVQSYDSLEIICVNDGSYDDSLTILEEYAEKDSRIRVYSFEENVGVATCRNFALTKARGEYIGFVDSDDWVSIDFYKKLYERAKSGNYDLVKAGCYLAHSDGSRELSQYNAKIKNCREKNTFIGIGFQHEIWTALYRNSFLQNAQAQFPKISNGEDIVFLLNVLLHSPKISLVEEAPYYYRQLPNSATFSHSLSNMHSILTHFEMQCALLNDAQISQATYLEYYNDCIYKKMLIYFATIVFLELTNKECVPFLQRIRRIVKSCKYLNILLEFSTHAFLKRFIVKGAISESDVPLFLKEAYIAQPNFMSAYYRYWLRSKLSKGKTQRHYRTKYLICKKIKESESIATQKIHAGQCTDDHNQIISNYLKTSDKTEDMLKANVRKMATIRVPRI